MFLNLFLGMEEVALFRPFASVSYFVAMRYAGAYISHVPDDGIKTVLTTVHGSGIFGKDHQSPSITLTGASLGMFAS